MDAYPNRDNRRNKGSGRPNVLNNASNSPKSTVQNGINWMACVHSRVVICSRLGNATGRAGATARAVGNATDVVNVACEAEVWQDDRDQPGLATPSSYHQHTLLEPCYRSAARRCRILFKCMIAFSIVSDL
jgi:hypothetical protein